MAWPIALWVYLALTAGSAPLWRLALGLRLRRGLEDPERISERFGQTTRVRPKGPLLWMHAVSVGEAQALVSLIIRLIEESPDLSILLTTHTRTSAAALAARSLPERVIHQYAPVDCPGAVAQFFDHWRPDAGVVAEADLWPWLLRAAHARGIPLILLNTHVTERRWRRRRWIRSSNRALLTLFEAILVQDEASLERYALLGAPRERMATMGVLKAAALPLPDHPEERERLARAIGDRPRWLAASTRDVEEPLIIAAHALARQKHTDLLLLLAPRHPHLADLTEAAASSRFPPEMIARRSRGEPISPQTAIYIADTIGEMGLWYRLAPVAYIGQSLPVPGVVMTGKNPFEAAALGVLIVHGPNVGNFAAAYAQLARAQGAIMVDRPSALADAVLAAQDPAFRAPYLAGAAQVLAANDYPLEAALAATRALLDRRPILPALPMPRQRATLGSP